MAPVTIGVDAHAFTNSLAGASTLRLNHLEALADLRPDWRLTCYGETSDIPSSLQALAQRSNVDFHCADDFDPDEADIVHLCDPMGVQRGFDAPVRVFRGAKRYTATFYDLIPLHLYFRAWDKPLRRQYLSRLEQCVKSGTKFWRSPHTPARIRQTHVPRARPSHHGRPQHPGRVRDRKPDLVADTLARYGIRRPFLHVGALDPQKL
jgi:hypothetical protein